MNVFSSKDLQKMAVAFRNFDTVHTVSDIILLGEDGACTRIVIGEPKDEK